MRLSEFKDEEAIRVIADILPHVVEIAKNPAVKEARNENPFLYAAALLKEVPQEAIALLALLDNKDPAEYHCTGASVLFDVFNMISDPDLLALFGVRSKTLASSGSASTTGEATEADADS